MPNRPTVFLSYRRQSNADLARYIYDRLSRMGADVFLDVEAINGGRFAEIISKQIKARDFFIVVLAPDTLESEWVRREVAAAIKARKHIIPLETIGFDFIKHVPPELRELAEYGGIPYDFKAPDKAFERIARALGIQNTSRRVSLPVIFAGLALLIIIAAFVILRPSTPSTVSTIVPSTTIAEQSTQTSLALSPTSDQSTATIASVLSTATLTIPPIPTSAPIAAPTVNAQTKAYPCDAAIVFTNGALLNQVRVLPQKNSIYRSPVAQGAAVVVLDRKKNDAIDWYQIRYNDTVTGWIPIEYVVPSSNCP